jgi:ABC-type branched-subunit amino acid transport system substrate-binding protein
VNAEQGGVCGRKIVLDALDDNYDPARATEVIRKLVDQEKVFAVVLGLGTAAHSAVWEYLNEKGIPDLFVMTGAHKWAATPEQHPWTFAGLPDYFIEGTLYGNWISDNMPGTKVGVLYQNDDYGRDELAGVKNGLDPTKNEVVSEQAFESTAVSIASQVANLKASGAGAVICGCIPGHAAQAIKGANALGWKPQWFIGYVNSDPVMFSYASPGDMEGTLTMQGNKLSGWTDDPGIAAHIEIMKTYGNAPVGNFTVEGHLVAELTVHALSLTCDNPTHEGLKEAVESIQGWQSELMLEGGPGFSWSPTDHNTVEAMRLLRAKLIPGGGGAWEYEGPILSFNP